MRCPYSLLDLGFETCSISFNYKVSICGLRKQGKFIQGNWELPWTIAGLRSPWSAWNRQKISTGTRHQLGNPGGGPGQPGLQVFLIFIAPLRPRSASRFARFVVWSCYLLADWVADLCLGLLLNTLGNIGTPAAPVSSPPPPEQQRSGSGSGCNNTSSPVIFAFWAPPPPPPRRPDTITAFSVEDNELWRRHLIGLLFELFAAATVFSAPSRATRLSSPPSPCSSSASSSTPSAPTASTVGAPTACAAPCSASRPGPDYAELIQKYDFSKFALESEDTDWKLDKDSPLNPPHSNSTKNSDLDADKAFELIEVELGFVYDIVYTKAAAVHTRAGYALRLIGSACIAAALLTFFFVDKRGFTRLDVAITYALLLGAVVLDAAALMMLLSSDWTRVFCADNPFFNKCCLFIENKYSWLRLRRRGRRWSRKVSRLSLIGYCLEGHGGAEGVRVQEVEGKGVGGKRLREDKGGVRAKRRRGAQEAAERKLGGAEQKLDVQTESSEVQNEISDVQNESSEVQNEISDVQNESPEVQTESSDVQKKISELIRECVEVDFDQSLLLWHIATELCYYQDKTSAQNDETEKLKRISMAVSEYLLYLLVMQPAMLSTVAGIGMLRYRDTCADARRFFRSKRGRQLNGDHAGALLAVKTDVKPAVVKGDHSKSVLFDACILAKQLGMLDGEKKWEVVVSEMWGGDARLRGVPTAARRRTRAAEPRRRARHRRLAPHGARGAGAALPDPVPHPLPICSI
uniref:DUF4220 domain-containing protein n=1 Tax=Ananas comosus var. bracteatus TaxID=296719 RepID=A0A6V7QDG2_ANACO|nr:unnamed protein product [Ananas comosus var. bracteatus]